MGQEVELKLEVAGDSFAALAASDVLAGTGETVQLDATYFDTGQQDLWRRAISLRIRQEGGQLVQTVKQPASGGGLFQRREWEMPVNGHEPVTDPRTPVAALLAERGGRLIPAFTVVASRQRWRHETPGAAIEVAFDSGEVRAAGRSALLREIELECLSGDPAETFALARRLDQIVPLRIGVLAKAERGFALLGAAAVSHTAEKVRLDPAMTPDAAFAAIARSCLRQYRLNETVLLETRSPDAVHQARIALRRLRSAMTVFRDLLVEPRTAQLVERIRRLAATLGRARDLDVMLERAPEGVLRQQLEAAQRRAYERLEHTLASAEARHLMLDLAEWLALGAWCSDPATAEIRAMPLTDFARDALDRARRKVRRHGKHLAKVDEDARHRLRKDAKKLRYALEFLSGLFSDTATDRHRRKFRKALKHLQDELGALNDNAVARAQLARLGLADSGEAEQFLAAWQTPDLIDEAAESRHDLLKLKPFWR